MPVEQMERVDPLARARAAMSAGEAAEETARRDQADADHARFEQKLMAAEMVARSEVAAQGFTSAELAAHQQEREQVRAAEISEHLDALRRLDPSRFGDGMPIQRMALALPGDGGEVVISSPGPGVTGGDPFELLARHQAGEAEWQSGPVRHQRIAALEAGAGRTGDAAPPSRRPRGRGRRPVLAAAPARVIMRADALYPAEPTLPAGPALGAAGDW